MRRVLELGAGRYSTPFFLALADLDLLWTIETDTKWFEECKNDDPRHAMCRSAYATEALPSLSLFDLVFIDDGGSAADRERTIRTVLGQPHPSTVIHDAEVPAYAKAIEESGDHYMIFDEGEPWTALVWR